MTLSADDRASEHAEHIAQAITRVIDLAEHRPQPRLEATPVHDQLVRDLAEPEPRPDLLPAIWAAMLTLAVLIGIAAAVKWG